MKINVLSVGKKMPVWVEQGVLEYTKRLPADFSVVLQEVPLAKRSKSSTASQCLKKESAALIAKIKPGDYVIAMEVAGKAMDTGSLAQRISELRTSGQNISLLIGGPDGLGAECRALARESWSLSALTLPHPLVRVVLAEQLYRVWTVLNGHPYHRK